MSESKQKQEVKLDRTLEKFTSFTMFLKFLMKKMINFSESMFRNWLTQVEGKTPDEVEEIVKDDLDSLRKKIDKNRFPNFDSNDGVWEYEKRQVPKNKICPLFYSFKILNFLNFSNKILHF